MQCKVHHDAMLSSTYFFLAVFLVERETHICAAPQRSLPQLTSMATAKKVLGKFVLQNKGLFKEDMKA